MNQVSDVLRALVSPKWRWVTVAVLLIMAGLARLGFWQLDRLEERRVENAALLAVLTSEIVDVNTAVFPTLDDISTDAASFKDRQAIVKGRFDFSQQGLIKLQTWRGQPGVYLIAPLVLEDGKTAVLVNRGWIPEAEREDLAQFDEVGEIVVEGYLALTQTLSRGGGETAVTALEWFRVDIAQIQQSLSYELLPVYLIQAPRETLQTTPPFRLEQNIDLSEGPHLSYAIQWFIFSLIGGVGYLVVVRRSLQQDTD
ncbi:MAG: SURF1 family protein [Chloroflexota bacterium]